MAKPAKSLAERKKALIDDQEYLSEKEKEKEKNKIDKISTKKLETNGKELYELEPEEFLDTNYDQKEEVTEEPIFFKDEDREEENEYPDFGKEFLNITAEELTERFVRGDASRNTEGSGLGLNIAQSLMRLQHGNMEVTVDGDLFKVTLTFPAE